MLTIRREQMEALGAYMRQSFEDRMVRHAGAAFPMACKKLKGTAPDDTGVREFLRAAIRKAEEYGIRAEGDVASYVEFALVNGLDFELRPGMEPIHHLLKDSKLPGSAKVFAVQDNLSRTRLRDERQTSRP